MLQTYGAVNIFLITCSIQANFCILVFRMISEFRDMSYLHTHLNESNDKDSVVRYSDPINILFFTAFVMTKISESCICAFAGSQLINESEDFRRTVYSINWHGNKQLTSWVLITLNQRPMTLVACHYTTISLNILVSIVNTTISYYFLLKTLQGG
ncbi:hypothetical protein PV327_007373 [Microctonus hyperodae]|uniref:Uncharacterized protein n=1 Tax=Microctonus hyperodae TaxID=165561 RepID=A0AA39FZ11_MICHY|nr:hypothetical protein PV327_007373 [Microctonus hyperodae]